MKILIKIKYQFKLLRKSISKFTELVKLDKLAISQININLWIKVYYEIYFVFLIITNVLYDEIF